jgi:carbon monoxide dehydrogenase subunit G
MKGNEYHPAVKNYLEGKTDKLDDTEFEEPIIFSSTNKDEGYRYNDFYSNFKPGGKGYKAADARSKSIEGKYYQAQKAGNINQYNTSETPENMKKYGYGSRGTATDLDQFRKKPVKAEYNKPTPAKPSVPEDLTLPGKMDIRKAGPIKSTTKGNFNKKDISKPEKAAFVNPSKNVKMGKNVSMNPLAQGATSKGAGKRYVRQVVESIGKTGDNNRGYRKEEKGFKAYVGKTATDGSFEGMLSGDIKKYRQEAKSIRADYRKQADSDVKSMGKAAMTSEIRQSRKAQAFAKAAEKGKTKFFTDKKYGGNIKKNYRESKDNAVIRDNMDAKLKAIGAKESKRLSELEASKKGGFQYNNFGQQ